MTDAASKAQEIVREWVDRTYLKPVSFWDCRTLENAIESAISAAVAEERAEMAKYVKANGLSARTVLAALQAERERAGKLVDAASKAVKADAKREWGGDPEMQYLAECLDAYEVKP